MLQAALDQAGLPCSEIDSSQWGSDRQALQNVGAKGVNSNKLAIFVVKESEKSQSESRRRKQVELYPRGWLAISCNLPSTHSSLPCLQTLETTGPCSLEPLEPCIWARHQYNFIATAPLADVHVPSKGLSCSDLDLRTKIGIRHRQYCIFSIAIFQICSSISSLIPVLISCLEKGGRSSQLEELGDVWR